VSATTIVVGNIKIFGDNIQNYSTNPHRRVELVAELAHSRESVAKIANVLTSPAPDVEIVESNFAVPVLAVRPHCDNKNYWQVNFDTNRVIREAFGEAGFSTPEQHYLVRRSA
jgi:small conductance mechanosensitive channel